MRRFVVAATVAIASLMLFYASASSYAQADDDWKVIERHSNNAPAEPAAASAPKAGGMVVACGEEAQPAPEPYKSIVAQLNDMWGTSFPVYESTRPVSPHARAGGCIFFNAKPISALYASLAVSSLIVA